MNISAKQRLMPRKDRVLRRARHCQCALAPAALPVSPARGGRGGGAGHRALSVPILSWLTSGSSGSGAASWVSAAGSAQHMPG